MLQHAIEVLALLSLSVRRDVGLQISGRAFEKRLIPVQPFFEYLNTGLLQLDPNLMSDAAVL
jgi:hypothetical protein